MINVALCHNETDFLCDAQSIYLQKLIPLLEARGFIVTLLLISPRSPKKCFLWTFCEENDYRIKASPSLGSMTNNMRWLIETADAIRADVIVTHHCHWALSAAASLREVGISTIGVLHCEDDATRRMLELYGATGSPLLQSRLVAVSPGVAEMANQFGVIVPVTTITNGIEFEHTSENKRNYPLKVCYFGRLVQQQKRILDLTDQFCKAAELLSDVEFHIWGGGEQQPDVRNILLDRGSGLPVYLHEAIPNPEVLARMREHDVIVLLSDFEGLPFSLLEGMSCGLVPVVSDFDKSNDPLVIHGVNGLVLNDHKSDFISAIQLLRDKNDLFERLRKAARSKIASDFGIEAWADNWAGLIRDTVESEDPPHFPRSRNIVDIPKKYQLPEGKYFSAPLDYFVKLGARARALF